jgi:hypothetical protein
MVLELMLLFFYIKIIAWNQAEGNNIHVTGMDKSGSPKSPGYGMKLGFRNGTSRS